MELINQKFVPYMDHKVYMKSTYRQYCNVSKIESYSFSLMTKLVHTDWFPLNEFYQPFSVTSVIKSNQKYFWLISFA